MTIDTCTHTQTTPIVSTTDLEKVTAYFCWVCQAKLPATADYSTDALCCEEDSEQANDCGCEWYESCYHCLVCPNGDEDDGAPRDYDPYFCKHGIEVGEYCQACDEAYDKSLPEIPEHTCVMETDHHGYPYCTICGDIPF